ncbi:MAG: hypothetical protein ACI97N_000310 [Cognaticolwellia sp.]|jgi:hypothetical protein
MNLLIPILVDALVVDDVLNQTESNAWARNAADYKQTLAFQAPNSDILERTGDAKTGIHLQWILPDELCHGEQGENENVAFHKVPNRWLVNRLHLDKNGEIAVKSWMVLSDFIDYNPSQNANYLYENNGKMVAIRLGKVVDLTDFEGDTGNEELFLTAIGAGNAAFNSFTPDNENVFSFIDDLNEFENENLKFTYLVAGWYSNPDETPNVEFRSSNIISTENNIFHGAIYDINWYGKAGDDFKSISGKPDKIGGIIIANSSFDALVRLVQHEMRTEGEDTQETLNRTKQTARLLAAFEHHALENLDKPGGLSELDKQIHDAWFDGENGGTIWKITPTEPQNDFDENLRDSGAIPLLNQLNDTQIEFDKQLNIKGSKQTELYTAWIQTNRNSEISDLKSQYKTLFDKFQSFETELKTLSEKRKKFLSELNNLLEIKFENKAKLKQKMQPKFWEANEPVILIHAAKSSDKYGFEKELTNRTSDEIISKLKEHYSQQVINFQTPTLPNLDKIPAKIQDLIIETILLNPNFSTFLNQKATGTEKTTPESIEKQQTLIWNDEIYRQLNTDKLTALAGFTGKRPSLRAFSKCLPTWSPLFLDWQVDYHPNGDFQNTDGWNLKNFSFETDNDNINYSKNNKISFSGRSLLSSQASKVLEAKLKNFRKSITDESEKIILDEVINIISQFDILTQRLSGFNEMLTGLDINDIIPIATKNKDLKNAVNGGTLGLPINSDKKFVTRNGFLNPQLIRITDDFGLAIYPHDFQNKQPIQFLKGEGNDHKDLINSNVTLLPPRIIQPSRITMNWIGSTTGKPLIIAADDHPIIGWIMTDFLDKSLEVFDASGDNIGELITVKRAEKAAVRWLEKDGKSIDNPQLNNFKDGILNYGNSASALSALMLSINDSLMLNHLENYQSDALSMLIGQPLALVRAKVTLEVKGLVDERLKNIEFPIQIGKQELATNGIVGYYKNMDFSKLYVLNDKDQSDYLEQAEFENISIEHEIDIVLVMNPNCVVHIISGILPVFELSLSSKLTKKAIQNMNVSFRIGPIINDADNLRLPKPSDSSKKLIWQQNGKEQQEIQTATQDASFPKSRNKLSEGNLLIEN